MKTAPSLLLLLLALGVPLPAAEPPPLGYQDTPLLPGTRWHVHDGTRPPPPVIAPGTPATADAPGEPPSDAIVLFNGQDLSAWQSAAGGPAAWKVENGYTEINGTGDLTTRAEFGPDVQLHVEWATPAPPHGSGQRRGNSGLFLMGRYELQVLDSFESRTYPDGQASAVYGFLPPLVNASRPPGQWQTYDLIFQAPRFAGARLLRTAFLTVLHNGVLTQHHTPLRGETRHRELGAYHPHGEKGPLRLQDHGDPVRYRRIWLRELALPGPEELGSAPEIAE